MQQNYEESKLENWLKKRHMSTKYFTNLVGCSRPVIWKVKRGIPICPEYAKRINQITEGEINPLFMSVGRPVTL